MSDNSIIQAVTTSVSKASTHYSLIIIYSPFIKLEVSYQEIIFIFKFVLNSQPLTNKTVFHLHEYGSCVTLDGKL
jgi:hypothetical protein